MYTQCQHCQAIFRVNMREVTVSNGLLRCGECLKIFDSSKNISTTMQEPFNAIDINKKIPEQNLEAEKLQTLRSLDDWQSSPTSTPSQNQVDLRQSPTQTSKKDEQRTSRKKNIPTIKGVEKKPQKQKKVTNWPVITALFLSFLLCLQVAYNYRHLLFESSKYDPEKIHMLNHNVFAHPIEKNVLLISAAIENQAAFNQKFPILEVRLTNSKTELVALRRFTPDEYLDNYSSSTLLIKNRPTSIKLKIKDPGNQATRFQFNFL